MKTQKFNILKQSLLLLIILSTFALSCNRSTTSVSKNNPPKTDTEQSKIPKPAVKFVKSDKLMPQLERAKKENKLVFIDFYTTWCLPCKLMDEEVFMDNKVGNFMNDKFISLKVNAEQGNGANLATIFQIRAYPTLLFLNAEGEVLQRKEGVAYQAEFMKMAEKAVASN